MWGSTLRRFSAGAALCAAFIAGATTPGSAKDGDTWPVKGKLEGKKANKKSEDVSGIACATDAGFPRACLVIDDNRQHAQFVTLEDGQIVAGESERLITNTHDTEPLELDGEGVAFAGGAYYVIGSHGHPRDKEHKLKPDEIQARIAASSQIVRLQRNSGGSGWSATSTGKLRDVILAEPTLRPFADRRLEKNGVTIEGIAIRGDRLLAGFRGPTLPDGRAAVLSVALDALFGSGTAAPRLHRLRLGDGQGVRDLAPYRNGILILAGPTADGPGQYAVFWWDGESEDVRRLRDLADVIGDNADLKPEALLALDSDASGLRVLILFDGGKEGAPVAVRMPNP